jgi:hypothetical protein
MHSGCTHAAAAALKYNDGVMGTQQVQRTYKECCSFQCEACGERVTKRVIDSLRPMVSQLCGMQGASQVLRLSTGIPKEVRSLSTQPEGPWWYVVEVDVGHRAAFPDTNNAMSHTALLAERF